MTYALDDKYECIPRCRGFFGRNAKAVDSDRISELESELESTRAVLEFTKSSVCGK
jgi:hypothetical protein